MRIIVLFDADDNCVDPLDEAATPRRHYDEVVSGGDSLVMWREYGDHFKGGMRTHFVGSGVFENVQVKQLDKALRKLLSV